MAAERDRYREDGDAAARLQWGRDRMAAERGPARSRLLVADGFNGAATGWPRNDEFDGPMSVDSS